MKSQKPQSFVWYCKHGKKIKSSECSDCFKEFITEREIRVRADERAKLEKKFEFERKQMVDWGEANTKLQVEQARADVLKMVYEKAYKLDWSEDAFVIWLEAELKKVNGK